MSLSVCYRLPIPDSDNPLKRELMSVSLMLTYGLLEGQLFFCLDLFSPKIFPGYLISVPATTFFEVNINKHKMRPK